MQNFCFIKIFLIYYLLCFSNSYVFFLSLFPGTFFILIECKLSYTVDNTSLFSWQALHCFGTDPTLSYTLFGFHLHSPHS